VIGGARELLGLGPNRTPAHGAQLLQPREP
jgi:hypothetical protein